MKKYCHSYPTCPFCLEPHPTGSKVEFVGIFDKRKVYRCYSCNTFFYTEINLEKFNICNYIDYGGYSQKKYSFPLLWDIDLNEIEKSYIDWIVNEKPLGNFLITWPNDEVNFIPILVFEYLSNNPNAKVVIIDSFNEFHVRNTNSFSKPSYKEVFDYLYYFDEDSFIYQSWNEDISSDYRLFRKNKDFILKKIKKFHYHLKFLGDTQFNEMIDNSFPTCDFNNIIDFKNHIKKKLLQDYGKDSIKAIQYKELHGEWKSPRDLMSETGFLSVKIDERYEWSKNIFFNQSPYLNILLNINKIKSAKNQLSIMEVVNELNNNHNNNLFILNSSSEFNIFNEINKIKPDLIIFNNFDEFITRFIFYHDSLVNDFDYFIRNNQDSCMLFFSVNKDVRHLYRFNKEFSFIDKYNLIPHTWDNINVLNELDLDIMRKNPFSSYIKKFNNRNFNIKYIVDDSITLIETLVNEKKKDMGKDFSKFFKFLLQSPLYIYPNDDEFTQFKLDGRSFLDWLNIIQLKDLEFTYNVNEMFRKIYLNDDNLPSNPLLNKLIETILSIYNNSKNIKIKVIVHYYARKGVKKLLSNALNNEDLENIIEVITWNDLNKEISNINEASYLIAFSYPFFNYYIYNSPFTNFIFIGGQNHIDKIRFVVENRIDINTNSPIYFSIDDNAPKLLNDALNTIKDAVEPTVDLIEYFDDYEYEFRENSSNIYQNNNVSSIKLKSGNLVFLLKDNFGKGLFIPLNHSLTIKQSDYSVKDIKLDEINLDDLKGKEIILNNDFYTSYKEMFAKFVVEHGKNTIFNSPFKKWSGFYHLFSDAHLWLDATHSLVNSLSQRNNISISESKQYIAQLFTKNGIDVSLDRIINYWLSDPKKLETSEGILGIYELEKPRAYNHLEIIFEVLIENKDYIPNYHFNSNSVKVSYEAILILQSIRRNFLKEENIQSKYHYLHKQLLKEIEKIIKLSSSFVISNVDKVSLTKDVSAYRIIDNYDAYSGDGL